MGYPGLLGTVTLDRSTDDVASGSFDIVFGADAGEWSVTFCAPNAASLYCAQPGACN